MIVRTASLLSLAAVAACSFGDSAGARISVAGWFERGASVQVGAARASRLVPADSVSLTFSPSDAAETTSPGIVRLLKTGQLRITARLPDGGVVSTEILVGLPPKIVFDMIVDGNRDIYRASLDGLDLERLTDDPADDQDPSSVGGSVVFTSFRTGNADIFARSSTGALSPLTVGTAAESQPELSPDGLKLAFAREDTDGRRVWIATATGTGAGKLASNYGFAAMTEAAPSWSVNSDQVAFMSTASGNASIYSAPATIGTTPAPLVNAIGDSARVEPAWSHTSAALAFVSGPGTSQLFVLPPDGGARVRITTSVDPVGQPTWLRDGRIVFTTFAAGQGKLNWVDPSSPTIVHAIPLTGSDPQRASAVLP